MLNKKEESNGYPSPLSTNEEKASVAYGLQYFKTMYYLISLCIYLHLDYPQRSLWVTVL